MPNLRGALVPWLPSWKGRRAAVAVALAVGVGLACKSAPAPTPVASVCGQHSDIESAQSLSDVYLSGGNYDEALPLLLCAVELHLKAPAPDLPAVATLRGKLGDVYLLRRNCQDAQAQYQQALDLLGQTSNPSTAALAGALDNQANGYIICGANYEKALAPLERALELRKQMLPPNPAGVAGAQQRLGVANYNLRRFDAAISHHQQALDLRSMPPADPQAVAAAHKSLGDAFRGRSDATFSADDQTQAIEHFQLALAAVPAGAKPDPVVVAGAEGGLGGVYLRLGRLDQARPHFEKALETIKAAPDAQPLEKAAALNNLAAVYLDQADYTPALDLLRQSLAILEATPGSADTATFYENLADVFLLTGESSSAQQYYQRALEMRRKDSRSGPLETATSLNSLARLYFSKKDNAQALKYAEQALTLVEDQYGAGHPATDRFLNDVARISRAGGDTARALQLYQRALAIRKASQPADHPSIATSLYNLAALHISRQEYDQALPLLKEALAIQERSLGPEHPSTAISRGNLGILYASLGDTPQALKLLDEALHVEDRVFDRVFAGASERQKLWFTQANRSTYNAALSLVNRRLSNDPAAVRFGLKLVLERKGIVLDAEAQAQAARGANLTGEALAAQQRLQQNRGALAQLVLRGPGGQSFDAFPKRIQELETLIAQDEQLLARQSSGVARLSFLREVAPDQLALRLPKDAVLVEFVRIQDWAEAAQGFGDTGRYLAFVLTPDNRVALADLGDAGRIDGAVVAALEAINSPNFVRDPAGASRQADAALTALYGLTVAPLRAHLAAQQRLIISADGELNKVPFVALRSPQGRYLIEDYIISYVATGRDLLRQAPPKASGGDLFLVADPTFDAAEVLAPLTSPVRGGRAAELRIKWPRLPGTALEAQSIPPLVTGSSKVVLTGKDATEAAVQARLSSSPPRVVHFATHGYFLKDQVVPLSRLEDLIGADSGLTTRAPEVVTLEVPSWFSADEDPEAGTRAISTMGRSLLALAGANFAVTAEPANDGILTALEITGWDLRSTELVVLSACQTALGEVSVGQGVFGLRRAFALAGAQNLVMSLWPVSDQVTLEQMQRFYQELGRGRSTADALRQAQLETIRLSPAEMQRRFGQPTAPVNVWAPFILQQTVN